MCVWYTGVLVTPWAHWHAVSPGIYAFSVASYTLMQGFYCKQHIWCWRMTSAAEATLPLETYTLSAWLH